MRFVPGGPDIPNPLIKEWRNGDVLFLAGAGVSAPSKLPLFDGLALSVYERLGDALFSVLNDALRFSRLSRRAKIVDAAKLPPEVKVEADLFLSKQFDRLFSALEKRIDPDIPRRPKTRRIREKVEEVLTGKGPSQSHNDLLQLSLAPNATIDRSRSASCRIVTTNFDLLFEAAWQKLFSSKPISFDARVAPRPGAHNFEGIIHLHGSLTDNPNHLGDYILSSRDFARVYLRSGVIGNYVYDLIRRYRVVLVGYSADDPPMRYLMDAIGEDTSLFIDMRKPYAITDLSVDPADPAAALDKAVWESKEITPIFFKRGSRKQPYEPLWASLNAWANWSRDDADWVGRRLEENTKIKRVDASPFQRAFVQDLLEILSADEREKAISDLSKKKLDFGWVETINAAVTVAKSTTDGVRR